MPEKELPKLDEEPTSGKYVDHDAEPLSDEEAREGNEEGGADDFLGSNQEGR